MDIKTSIAIAVHLLLPLLGLVVFWLLRRKMLREKVKYAPVIDLFLIFATYGGLLLVVYTTYWWKWSGMASIGAAYLVVLAPIVMLVIGYRQYSNRSLSHYHAWVFTLALLYFILAPLVFIILSVSSRN